MSVLSRMLFSVLLNIYLFGDRYTGRPLYVSVV